MKRKDSSHHRAQTFRDLNGDLQSCSYTSLGSFKSFEEGFMPMAARELLSARGMLGETQVCGTPDKQAKAAQAESHCLSESDCCYVKGQGLWENKLVSEGQFRSLTSL